MTEITPERMEAIAAKHKKDLEDCGGDYLTYLRKHNRHTLKVSLLNEQCNEELWEGNSITFFNEDNAISHLSVVSELLDLLTREENKSWGYKTTPQEVVDRIINPIKDRLVGEMDTYRIEEED